MEELNQLDAEFKQLSKKVKRKRNLTTLGISLLTILIVLGISYQVSQVFVRKAYQKTDEYVAVLETIQAPNIQSNSRYITNNGLLSGTVTSHRYKEIAGYRVPWSAFNQPFGLFGWQNQADSSQDMLSDGYDRLTHQKVPVFYNDKAGKNAENNPKPNELEKMASMKNYVGEVALTFDRSYSYEEIRQLIPHNLEINWYWVGALGKENQASSGMPVIGYQAEKSEIKQESYEFFKKQLTLAKDQYEHQVNGISIYDKTWKQYKNIDQIAEAPFKGVIVTGRTEDFKQLVDQSFIQASSVGTTIECVPYINVKVNQ